MFALKHDIYCSKNSIMTCVCKSSMNWQVCYLLNVHASIFQSSYEKWNWHFIYAKLVAPFVSHPLSLIISVNLTITKWYETSFNIYCFSNYCVPTSLLSLYRLFPCNESVYILYDILVRVFVNTISDILSDVACSIF